METTQSFHEVVVYCIYLFFLFETKIIRNKSRKYSIIDEYIIIYLVIVKKVFGGIVYAKNKKIRIA